MEKIKDATLLLKQVGTEAHQVLRRMELDFVPEVVLEENVQMRARLLAGEAGATRLTDMLFRKFALAVPQRATPPHP